MASLIEDYAIIGDLLHRRQIGNFPQAFSHEPLVNSAAALSAHRQSTTQGGRPTGEGPAPGPSARP